MTKVSTWPIAAMMSQTGTVASSTTIAPNAQDLVSALAITVRFTILVVMTITTTVPN